jgi:Glycosyltransferase family 87
MSSRRVITGVAILLCGMLLIHGLVLWQVRDVIAKGYPDFTTFYMAGKMVRTGLGHDLYDLRAEWRVQQEFAPWVSIRQAALPYMHAPFEALLFVPLTLLPYGAAFALWNGLNLLILLVLPYLLRPQLPVLTRLSPLLILGIELACFPIFFVLLQGQDTILLLLFYSLTYVSLKRGAEGFAGFWLACGLFRFHLILPFMVVVVLTKKFRALAAFSVTGFVLVLLSAWVVGWRTLLHYPGYIWWLEQHKSQVILTPSDTTNIRGLLDTFLGKWTPPHLLLGLVIVLSLVALYLALKVWHSAEAAPEKFDLAFSVTLIATVLVGYHSFIYDLTVLLIPVAVTLGVLLRSRSLSPWIRSSLIIPVVAFFCTPLYLFLWFRLHHPNLMALFLILWFAALFKTASQTSAWKSSNQAIPASIS